MGKEREISTRITILIIISNSKNLGMYIARATVSAKNQKRSGVGSML